MKNENEYAKRLLKHRENGYSIIYAIKNNWKKYLFSITVFVMSLLITLAYLNNYVLYFLVGLYIGTFLRDFGWFINIKKLWSFSEKIIDWNKVKEIAES